jgi:hypothetical protein
MCGRPLTSENAQTAAHGLAWFMEIFNRTYWLVGHYPILPDNTGLLARHYCFGKIS